MNKIKKQIDSMMSAPKLFGWYLFVNIIPSLFLIYTEPLNIAGKAILLLFPLGVYMILYSVSKRTGLIQLLLIPFLVIHAFQLVVFYLFKEDVLAVDMFLNLPSTNPSEAGELLNSIWPSIIAVCVIYIPTIIAAIMQEKRKIVLKKSIRKWTISLGGGLIGLSFVLSSCAQNVNTNRFAFYKDIYPWDIFYNLKFAIHKWHNIKSFPVTSEHFTYEAKKDTAYTKEREVYVLVIGETSRADNWELYGYERATNPKLSKEPDVIRFKDVITQSNVTHKSVSILLSSAAAEDYDIIYQQKSIIEAFEEVGITTVFLSNQADNGMLTQYYAENADYYHNIRSVGKHHIENNYDDALLPLFEHYLDSIPGDMFFVLHTYGSHFNYRERYPDKYSVFTPDDVKDIRRKDRDKLINAYDNSIVFTDHLLAQLIETLKKDSICSAMMYLSDHGEDIMDDRLYRFLHASPTPSYYQLRVPLLMWFSPEYQTLFPEKVSGAKHNIEKPIASNVVFHTLLDIASIETEYLDRDLSLVNPDFEVQTRMYLDDHDEPISFFELNLKKEDRAMIEKQNIHH